MTVATFKGIELNPSPYSALLFEAAMEGHKDADWVELLAIILFSKDSYKVPQWVRIFKSQIHSSNSFVRYQLQLVEIEI